MTSSSKTALTSPRAREPHAYYAAEPAQLVEIIGERERSNFRLGLLLILVAIATWMFGLELVNAILKTSEYKKPFLFSYLTGSCFVIYLAPDVRYLWQPMEQQPEKHSHLVPLTRAEVASLSVTIAFVYYCYMVVSTASLKFTAASNQTILGSIASVFTLLAGVYMKIDKFTRTKVVCIVASFVGLVLVNFGDSRASGPDDNNKYIPKNPALGNCLAVVGAAMYTAYMVIIKTSCGTGNRTTNERRLFGFVGLIIIAVGPFFLYFAHLTGLEPFELPKEGNMVLVAMFVSGLFNAISDYVTILAVLLTSPLVTSLSLTSSIPITVFIDYLVIRLHGGSKHPHGNRVSYFLGILSILMSVILINITSSAETELIEDVIEDALDQAIRHDEILSPVLSPLLSAMPHSQFTSPLLSPFSRPKAHQRVSNLSLEGEALINRNHSSHLYTVDTRETGDNTLVMYGGNNHKYYIERIDNDES